MNKKQRHELFVRFRAHNPHPKTELIYHSPFELLIAVLLSAQATDISVNKATLRLFAVANTPQAILDLGIDRLKTYIQSIGLYNTKAEHIMTTCALLLARFAGQVPATREDLESLPGVGRKTANVVLNTAFGQPTMAVDTHIFRVANRTGLASGKTPLAVEHGLLKNIDQEFLQDAHHWLILHGRYVCTARKPQCKSCIIKDLCEYKDKNES
ncbi:MAG: endonuclease III [Legionella sp.]|nr:MAG: endonuclease III [Legionella sp.]PJD97403.1 MAG: endonuclease III [Legionella sp.]